MTTLRNNVLWVGTVAAVCAALALLPLVSYAETSIDASANTGVYTNWRDQEYVGPGGPNTPPSRGVCTMDAYQCPDGSWVGRSGPNCEFVCAGTVQSAPSVSVEADATAGSSGFNIGAWLQSFFEFNWWPFW